MSPLDNPIWNALASRHRSYAISYGAAKRYPPTTAPFVAVSEESASAEVDLRGIVDAGEQVAILSVIPELTDGWRVLKAMDLRQYVFPGERGFEPDPEIVALDEHHIPLLLELTALVYPAYFRAGTAQLGQYFGIFDGERLAAMAGIRMAMNGYQEISAVCTHPDYRGQGYAHRLLRHTVGYIRDQGDTPFLHTEADNAAAQAIYDALGFEVRAVLPFRILERVNIAL